MLRSVLAASALALTLAACQTGSGPVSSGGYRPVGYNQDFTVFNGSYNPIYYIYVSPITTDSWEEDVLGNDVVMPGDSVDIDMQGYGGQCLFDIRIEDSQGYSQEYHRVDLCSVSSITYR